MKRLIICALLCAVPFASVRVVCFNADTAARQSAVLRQQPPSAPDECERMCSRTAHRAQPPPAHTTCALVANPTCGFLMDAAVAVMPVPMQAPAASPMSPVVAIRHDAYVAPPLALRTPPPKA